VRSWHFPLCRVIYFCQHCFTMCQSTMPYFGLVVANFSPRFSWLGGYVGQCHCSRLLWQLSF
jgi:hypothetical protein